MAGDGDHANGVLPGIECLRRGIHGRGRSCRSATALGLGHRVAEGEHHSEYENQDGNNTVSAFHELSLSKLGIGQRPF